jgi:hypothetical protein
MPLNTLSTIIPSVILHIKYAKRRLNDSTWLGEFDDGAVGRETGNGAGFSMYLSHDDAGRFYQACVESEPVRVAMGRRVIQCPPPSARTQRYYYDHTSGSCE